MLKITRTTPRKNIALVKPVIDINKAEICFLILGKVLSAFNGRRVLSVLRALKLILLL